MVSGSGWHEVPAEVGQEDGDLSQVEGGQETPPASERIQETDHRAAKLDVGALEQLLNATADT